MKGKKSLLQTVPGVLEKKERIHMEFTADGESSDSDILHRRKDSWDNFEDSCLNAQLDLCQSTDYTEPIDQYQQLLPYTQQGINFSEKSHMGDFFGVFVNQHKPSLDMNFSPELTSQIDWYAEIQNVSQIDVFPEASQSVEIENQNQKKQDKHKKQKKQRNIQEQQLNLDNQMFKTDLQENIITLDTQEEFQNFKHIHPNFFKFRILPVDKTLQMQIFQIQIEDKQEQKEKSNLSNQISEKETSVVKQSKKQCNNKKSKKQNKNKQIEENSRTYIQFVDNQIHFDQVINSLETSFLIPFKILFMPILLFLSLLFLIGYNSLLFIQEILIFILGLVKSKQFRLPLIITILILPTICSISTQVLKLLSTSNYQHKQNQNQNNQRFQSFKVQNYLLSDPIEHNFLPDAAKQISLYNQLLYNTQYNLSLLKIADLQRLKLLSLRLNTQYKFKSFESLINYNYLQQDDTALVINNVSSLETCYHIKSNEYYLAGKCNLNGPTLQGFRQIQNKNIRSLFKYRNKYHLTLSDEFSNGLKLVLPTDIKIYIKKFANNYYNFKDILVTTNQLDIEFETFNLEYGIEGLTGYNKEQIKDNHTIYLLNQRPEGQEITIQVHFSNSRSVCSDYELFDMQFFDVLNYQFLNISHNVVKQRKHISQQVLNIHYNNLRLEQSGTQKENINEKFNQIQNWKLHQLIIQEFPSSLAVQEVSQYLYLIFAVYIHQFIIFIGVSFLISCYFQLRFQIITKYTKILWLLLNIILIAVQFYCSKYILSLLYSFSLINKMTLIIIIIQIIEITIPNKQTLQSFILLLLFDNLHRQELLSTSYNKGFVILSMFIFVKQLTRKESIQNLLNLTSSQPYFLDGSPIKKSVDIQQTSYITILLLKYVQHIDIEPDSIMLTIFQSLSHFIFQKQSLFRKNKQYKKDNQIKRFGVQKAKAYSKLQIQIQIPTSFIAATLSADNTLPWNIDILKLNSLNIQNMQGYGQLLTNIKILSNDSLIQQKSKFLMGNTFYPIPSINQIMFLQQKLSSKYPLFNFIFDSTLSKSQLKPRLLPFQTIIAEHYEFKLTNIILPSQRMQTTFLDVANLISHDEFSQFDEICFFSTTFSNSRKIIQNQIVQPGKLFNLMVYPIYCAEWTNNLNIAQQNYIGSVKQVAVQDCGMEEVQNNCPVGGYIRDTYIPGLNMIELQFLISTFMLDFEGCGLLNNQKKNAQQNYCDIVNLQLNDLYKQIADEILEENVRKFSVSQCNLQKITYLAEFTPFLNGQFYQNNIFDIKDLQHYLLRNIDNVLRYFDIVAKNPNQDNFPEFVTIFNLKRLNLDCEFQTLQTLVNTSLHRQLEKQVITFVSYTYDVLASLLVKQQGYQPKYDTMNQSFIQIENIHNVLAFNDQCTEKCSETFFNHQPFYFENLCESCRQYFIQQIYTPLARFECFAFKRFYISLQKAIDCSQCQEDFIAILAQAGLINDQFVRLILKKEADLLYEARQHGQIAQKSSRSCFVQLNDQYFQFNMRKTCESIYAVNLLFSRMLLQRKAIGTEIGFINEINKAQTSILFEISQKRFMKVFNSKGVEISSGASFQIGTIPSDWAWATLE